MKDLIIKLCGKALITYIVGAYAGKIDASLHVHCPMFR